jgi:Response regulator receiver domain
LPAWEAAGTPLQSKTNPPHHILVVEDDIFLRHRNNEVLLRDGYEVDAAAWVALQSRSYDLLITDNQMPGLSGAEFVRKLRAAQMTLPVIFASGGLTRRTWPGASGFSRRSPCPNLLRPANCWKRWPRPWPSASFNAPRSPFRCQSTTLTTGASTNSCRRNRP